MSLWNKSSRPPLNLTAAEKRNVVVTDQGYVRVQKYTDTNGNARNKQEILVAGGPGWANSTNWGTAKVTDMWHSAATVARTVSALTGTVTIATGNTTVVGTSTLLNTQLAVGNHVKIGAVVFQVATVTNNTHITVSPAPGSSLSGQTISKVTSTTVNTYISFSEPLASSGLHGGLKVTVANTAGGNNMIATSNATVHNGEWIRFAWTPYVAGTYKIQAQTAANSSATAANTRSTNSGTELVSWVISGVASNNAGTVVVS